MNIMITFIVITKATVVGKLIYIIFIISYVILLLDFVTLSRVQFLEFKFNFNYIYIVFIFIFILYRLSHSLYTFIHMFVLYAFIFIFVIITSHCLHNVHICCLAIYSSMQSSFVLNIIVLIHHITFNILYSITIFNIHY